MKYEWKKQEKNLYGAKAAPTLVTVPRQNYIMIRGSGNPNDWEFSNKVSALFSLAYVIKMDYKAAADGSEVEDYSVYPLEGIWSLKHGGELVKEDLEYTIMIRQPDFISESMVLAALEKVNVKKPNPLYADMRFGSMQDGNCIQLLHTGPYDDEPASFAKLAQFAKEHDLTRTESCHREIYLNNAGRVEPGKLKTILRYSVV